MSVTKKFRNLFVGSSDDDYEEDDFEVQEEYEEEKNNTETLKNRIKNIQSSSSVQIVLSRPTDFSEVKPIGDDLNAGKTVLLNLENVSADVAKRFLDFLGGVAYANDADIKMMAQKTYAIMPKNVGFSGVDLMDEIENGYTNVNEF